MEETSELYERLDRMAVENDADLGWTRRTIERLQAKQHAGREDSGEAAQNPTPDVVDREFSMALDPSELDAAYERYCFESAAEAGQFLPMPLPRTDERNRCDICDQYPSADNPGWYIAGEPADPESGPSEREIPLRICERCDEAQANLYYEEEVQA